jgi:D-tagatose-1,6-bisphosphate aldolase subunit GatZ/KbaZ
MKHSFEKIVRAAGDQNAQTTLLGIGVMSRCTVDAAIEICSAYKSPLIFIASRNQVDSRRFGGGYANGWDTESFARYTNSKAAEYNFENWTYLCRDHGGPWQNDTELEQKIPWEEAYQNSLSSFCDDLDQGMDMLHIDPSRDWSFCDEVPLDIVADRTVDLIREIESYRCGKGFKRITYEISLEKTGACKSTVEDFDHFIGALNYKLTMLSLPNPLLVVGDTGTYVRMDKNIGTFEEGHVRQLAGIAKKHRVLLKEHNADYLGADILQRHAPNGICMLNVAPEFAFHETTALMELARLEKEYAVANKSDMRLSGLRKILWSHILRTGKWKKWTENPHDIACNMDDRSVQDRMISVCGHYFYHCEDVQKARRSLYEHARELGFCGDSEAFVTGRVKGGIKRYLDALNLNGFCDTVAEQAEQTEKVFAMN